MMHKIELLEMCWQVQMVSGFLMMMCGVVLYIAWTKIKLEENVQNAIKDKFHGDMDFIEGNEDGK